jgi:hypothetical protein
MQALPRPTTHLYSLDDITTEKTIRELGFGRAAIDKLDRKLRAYISSSEDVTTFSYREHPNRSSPRASHYSRYSPPREYPSSGLQYTDMDQYSNKLGRLYYHDPPNVHRRYPSQDGKAISRSILKTQGALSARNSHRNNDPSYLVPNSIEVQERINALRAENAAFKMGLLKSGLADLLLQRDIGVGTKSRGNTFAQEGAVHNLIPGEMKERSVGQGRKNTKSSEQNDLNLDKSCQNVNQEQNCSHDKKDTPQDGLCSKCSQKVHPEATQPQPDQPKESNIIEKSLCDKITEIVKDHLKEKEQLLGVIENQKDMLETLSKNLVQERSAQRQLFDEMMEAASSHYFDHVSQQGYNGKKERLDRSNRSLNPDANMEGTKVFKRELTGQDRMNQNIEMSDDGQDFKISNTVPRSKPNSADGRDPQHKLNHLRNMQKEKSRLVEIAAKRRDLEPGQFLSNQKAEQLRRSQQLVATAQKGTKQGETIEGTVDTAIVGEITPIEATVVKNAEGQQHLLPRDTVNVPQAIESNSAANFESSRDRLVPRGINSRSNSREKQNRRTLHPEIEHSPEQMKARNIRTSPTTSQEKKLKSTLKGHQRGVKSSGLKGSGTTVKKGVVKVGERPTGRASSKSKSKDKASKDRLGSQSIKKVGRTSAEKLAQEGLQKKDKSKSPSKSRSKSKVVPEKFRKLKNLGQTLQNLRQNASVQPQKRWVDSRKIERSALNKSDILAKKAVASSLARRLSHDKIRQRSNSVERMFASGALYTPDAKLLKENGFSNFKNGFISYFFAQKNLAPEYKKGVDRFVDRLAGFIRAKQFMNLKSKEMKAIKNN